VQAKRDGENMWPLCGRTSQLSLLLTVWLWPQGNDTWYLWPGMELVHVWWVF